MHIFGLFKTAQSLNELDDMVQSAAVLFSSPSSGENVHRHFQNLQSKLLTIGQLPDETNKKTIEAEDMKVSVQS